MSGRNEGFALITVLWIVAALAMLTTAGLADSDIARVAVQNRILLRRAEWSARACLAIVRSQAAHGDSTLTVDSTGLGDAGWCRGERLDPSERVNVNLADSVALARVLGDPLQTATLLDWRDGDDAQREAGAEGDWYRAAGRPPPRNAPLVDVAEIQMIRGFEDVPAEVLERFFTVRGDGRIDPNRAPVEVLNGISALPSGSAERLMRARRTANHLDDAEEVANAAAARLDAEGFRELTRQTVFEPRLHVVRVVGGAASGPRSVRAAMTVSFRASGDRLLVRRMEVGR
jgi:type II secretory pathway component PulK